MDRKRFMTRQLPRIDKHTLGQKKTEYQKEIIKEINKNKNLSNKNIYEINKILTTTLIKAGQ